MSPIRITGAYLLLLFNRKGREIKIGKIGVRLFPRGYYLYIGSGMGNLLKRVFRHIRTRKKKKWHIDYITDKFKLKKALIFPSKRRRECEISQILAKNFSIIKNFGSSDCRCRSHLFFALKRPKTLIRKIFKP